MNRWMSGPRGKSASIAVIGTAVAIVAAAAFNAPGYTTPKFDLHDAGVWLSRSEQQAVGRMNTQIREVDVRVPVPSPQFELLQADASVLLHLSGSEVDTIVPIDGRTATPGAAVSIPHGSQVAVVPRHEQEPAAAVLSPSGQLWVGTVPAILSVKIAGTPEDTPPSTTLPGAVALALGTDGVAHAYAPASGTIASVAADGGAARSRSVAGKRKGHDVQLSAVGALPVVLDHTTSELLVPGSTAVSLKGVGPNPVLQQVGAGDDDVVIATDGALIAFPLRGGKPRTLAEKGTGGASAPLVLGGCAYGAWSGSPSWAQACHGALGREGVLDRARPGRPIRIRTNRGKVVFNELESGESWLVQHGAALPVDWSQAVTEKLLDKGDESADLQSQDRRERDPEQKPPVAKDDFYATRPDRPVVVHPLENDTDPNEDVLVVEGVEQVSHGAQVLVVGGGQAVQVTPLAGSSEAVEFVYTAYDGHDGRAQARVRVDVHGFDRNAPPTLKPQETTVVSGASVSHDVLVDAVDPDGDPVSLVLPLEFDSTKGTVSADVSGVIVYTAPAGLLGDVAVPFVAEDDRHETSKGLLTVHVRPADHGNAPRVRGDHARTTVGHEVVIDVLANDTDADSEPLRVIGVSPFPGAEIEIDQLNRIRVLPTQVGVINVDYTVTDGPHTASGPLRVDVGEPIGQLPPVAVRDDVVLRPGIPAIVDVLANDSDENGDVLVVSTVAVPEPALVVVEVVDHQLLRISTADGNALAATTAFSYTVTDGATAVAGTVVVRPGASSGIDQAPRARDDAFSVRAGNAGAFDVLANDADPEAGRLTLALPPDDELGDLANRVFVQGSLLRFVAPEEPGTFTVPYFASDLRGNRASASAVIHVLPAGLPNNGPQAPDLTARTVAGRPVVIPIAVATADPDGDDVTVVGIGDRPPSHGTVTAIAADRLTYLPDRYEGGFYGTDAFTYRMRDSHGAEAPGTVRVGVATPATFNSRPVAVDDERQVAAGGTLTIDPVANDSDPDGDSLSLDEHAALRLPPGVPWSAKIEDGTVVFTANGLDAAAEAAFGYTVTDGVLTDAGVVHVRVADIANLPPVAQDDHVPPHAAGEAVTVDVLANDSDPDGAGSDLRVTAVDGFSGASVRREKQLAFAMPDHDVQLIYSVVDVAGAIGRGVVHVPLETVAATPPFANPDNASTNETTAVTKDVLANDLVSAGRTKTLLAVGPARHGTCEITGTKVQYRPTEDFNGTDGCSYVLGDGSGEDPTTQRTTGMLGVVVKRSGNTPPAFVEQPLRVVADSTVKVDLRPAASDPDEGDLKHLAFSDIKGETDVVTASFAGSVLSVDAKPNAVEGTVVRLTFTVGDGHDGGNVEGAVTVTLSEYAGALAVAVPDRVQTFQGIPTGPIKVLANDQLADNGKPLTIVKVSDVVGGALSHTETEITFSPAPDFHGDTTFTYTVDDQTRQVKRQATASVTVSVIGRPDRPPAPSVTRESGAVTLDWGVPAANGAPITSYRIRVVGGPVSGDAVRTASSNGFRFDGLSNGETYRFQVAAVNEAVDAARRAGALADAEYGPESASVIPNTIPKMPAPPTAKFDPAGGAIDVAWGDPGSDGTAVTRYVVQVSPPPKTGGGEQSIAATGGSMSLKVSELVNGTPYTFRVRAVNNLTLTEEGFSEFSEPSSPETPATRPAPPLKPKVADQGDKQLTVTWQEPAINGDAIRSYDVEVSKAGSVVGITHIADPSVRQSVITTDNGAQYTFRLRAENKAGWSEYGPASDPAVSYGVPGPVASVAADVDASGIGSGQAKLAFATPDENGSAISRYEYRAATNGSGSYGAWAALASSRIISGLANGTSYVFQVRGCNARGCASDPGAASNAVVPYGAPSTPSVSGGNNGSSITWSWSASDGNGRSIDHYELRLDGGGAFAVGGGQTTFSQGGYGDDGSTHTLSVVAVSTAADGARSRSGTGSASVTRPSPPPPTVNIREDGVSNGSACLGDAGTSRCQYLALQLLYFPPNSTYRADCQVYNDQGVWQTVASGNITTNSSGAYGWARPTPSCYVDAHHARMVVNGQFSNEISTYD